MGEVAPADRSRLLRSKRAQLSGIVTSRKRKLREFFAVCDNDGPLPQIKYENPDAPPTSAAEAHFLEVNDVLQDRFFDESNLPTRRQLRSDTSKQRPTPGKGESDEPVVDTSKKPAKTPPEVSRPRRGRGATPSSRSDAGQQEHVVDGDVNQGLPMQRSPSKGSQAGSLAGQSTPIDEAAPESKAEAQGQSDDGIPSGESERVRINTVLESRPNSPGVDPRNVLPVLTEDASQLQEPPIDGLDSNGAHHKAVTVHLPPKEVQERRLRGAEKAREEKEHPSVHTPRDTGRADVLSSPSSTIGAHSTATPALLDTSADTSPDNGSRYEADRLEAENEVQTPPELKESAQEIANKEEHDRVLQSQIDKARADILRSSPGAADTQLQMEDLAATSGGTQNFQPDVTENLNKPMATPNEADNVAEDIVEDRKEVDDMATETEPMTGVEESSVHPPRPQAKPREIADSEAGTLPVEPMDVETAPVVQDSFESHASLDDAAHKPPKTTAAVEAPDSKSPAISTLTPSKTPSTPSDAPPTLERMTTRVSSGAMRHKSVSEILGEIPRPNTASSERNGQKISDSDSAGNSSSPSRSTTPQSHRMRSLVEKAKEKERSKLSTVVFAKQPARPSHDSALIQSGGQSQDIKDDYFMPLFIATASTDRRGVVPPLDSLIQSAHKTITTANAYVPINENQTAKVLKRIYNLQSAGRWSLRQPERAKEPIRPSSHWDVLLQEAKWMRTDFREERKWKVAVARNMAFACAEWVAAGPEDRKLLQVKAKSPPVESGDVEMRDHSTPELVSSGEFDSPEDEFDEEPNLNLLETVAPTAIFGLQDDDVVFGLRRSPITDKLLEELPMYGSPLRVPPTDPSMIDIDPDRSWRKRALPLSKYVEGRMELKMEGPPRKKSRFQYEDEDEEEDSVVFGESRQKRPILAPENNDVALFNPEHKHIRDRIHAGHQFRPPSEFPMPLQSFFECRTASQWTWAEDDELKSLVREFSYNWSLISNMLSSRSLFSSGAERRTPWECFERWIHLEGLPADMQKTHYFRAYNSRVEAANRNVIAQQAPQPPGNASSQVQPQRRRTTTSVRVERRRNQKHLTLVDAMRKLAKKRETNLQKQQHAAGLAAMRKAQEVPQQRGALKTPQQLSKLKYDHEQRIKEQQLAFQQRVEAQRKAAMQARAAGQNPQQGMPNGPQQRPNPSNGLPPNGPPNPTGQNLTVPGQNQNQVRRPMPPQMQGQLPMQNNLRPPQGLMNGIPQAQMQSMQGQLPLPNPALDVGLVTQANRIAEQQRQAIQMRPQGQMPGPGQVYNSPPRNMNGMSGPGFPQMQNGMMPFPAGNNASSPGSNPSTQGQAGSPRMGHPQQLTGGMMTQAARLEESIRQKYPSATPDQVMRMMSETLAKSVHQRQGLVQSAMNAAAGGNINGMPIAMANGMPNGMGMNGMGANGRLPAGVESSPQVYAQMLRQQQEKQAQAAQAAQQAHQAQQAQQAQQGQQTQQATAAQPTANGQPSQQGHQNGK